MVAAGKAMPSPQSRPPIPHEIVANKSEGPRPQGYQKDSPKSQAEKTEADKAPIRYAQKAEDHKKSLSNLRQQAEPASKATAKLRSHETVVNKGEGDRPHGNPTDRTRLAEKTKAGKAPIGNAQEIEDHKKSLSKLHQQAQPASKVTAKLHSDETVANEGEGNWAHGYRIGRAKLADKTEAEKPPTGNAQKAGEHKKLLVERRLQEQFAGKGTAKPRREGVANKEDGDQAHDHRIDRAKSQAEKTQAKKAPAGNAKKSEDHKKSLSNLHEQVQPASKGAVKPHSHETVANEREGDRTHSYRKDRVKLAEKTEAEKVPSGNAQKAGDHNKSLVNERQQAQVASKGATKPRL